MSNEIRALNDYYQGLSRVQQLERVTQKDPSVNSAHDAVSALKKRKATLEQSLAMVDGWRAELAKVERMIAAAEEP